MNTIQKIKQLEDQIAELKKQAEELARKPWEPEGGEFYLPVYGTVRQGEPDEECRIAGSEYPTREAAESALPKVTFFKRLCCLAAELNPSGKVGGRFFVCQDWSCHIPCDEWEVREWSGKNPDITCVFETLNAARNAAELMTREKWSPNLS
jgi:hypothetical protein